MSHAYAIDGKAIAAKVRADVAVDVARMKAQHGFAPGLAVVLVGEDPASKVYVRNKAEQTVEVGMQSFEHKLPEETTEASSARSRRARSTAIRPCTASWCRCRCPSTSTASRCWSSIDPAKDVDGFHPMNVGKLSIGERALASLHARRLDHLAKSVKHDLSGLDAVVVGRSNIVGKPMAQLLLRENCTVTIAHSRTQNLPDVVRRADLVVAAIGKPEFVKGDWIKPGAIVIDVGINRIVKPDGKGKLVGDVAFAEAAAVAGAITPVPGGVGPMTIACLLKNTVEAAQMQKGLPAQAASSRRFGLPQRLAAVSQRFGDMHAADALGAVEIGECARHPQRPVEAARRQVQRLRRLAQQRDAFDVGCSDLLENTPTAIGVGAHRARAESDEATVPCSRAPG